MKVSDLLKYSYLKTIRDKKNIYFIVILLILSILLLGILNYSESFISSINTSLINDPKERKLVVFPDPDLFLLHYNEPDFDYGFDKLLELDHVSDVFYHQLEETGGVSSFKDSNRDGTIRFMYGSDATVPKIVAGKMFDKNATGVAVCPEIFYPSYDIKDAKKNKNSLLLRDDLLGKKFSVDVDKMEYIKGPKKVGTYTQEFEIVGLYEVASNEPIDSCFIALKDIEQIWSVSTRNLDDPTDPYTAKAVDRIVVIDDLKYKNEVIKEITDLGFEVDLYSELDYAYVNKIKNTCLIILTLVVLGIMLLTIFYTKKKIHNNSYEMGISKTMGYLDRDVLKLSSMQMLYMTMFASLLGMILYKILLMFIKKQFMNILVVEGIYYYLLDNLLMYIYAFVIIVFVSVIANIIMTRIHLNNNLINLMRDDKE